MSNGLSETTQYIHNYEQDRLDRIRANKNAVIENYINSYMKTTSQKRCKCSACQTENAIHPVKIYSNVSGVEEVWRCDSCGRVVLRKVPRKILVEWLNVDKRQEQTA